MDLYNPLEDEIPENTLLHNIFKDEENKSNYFVLLTSILLFLLVMLLAIVKLFKR